MYYSHYNKVLDEYWTWPNFSAKEMASRDGSILIVPELMTALQTARTSVGKPFKINSAYRSVSDNARVGGARRSRHLIGTAVDISLEGHDKDELYEALKEAGFKGFGFYNTFIHADLGPERSWGDVPTPTKKPAAPAAKATTGSTKGATKTSKKG